MCRKNISNIEDENLKDFNYFILLYQKYALETIRDCREFDYHLLKTLSISFILSILIIVVILLI